MYHLTQKASAYELLSTKLSIPRLVSPRVQRWSLLARLNAGLLNDGFAQKLTLLSAPAGFGKTTLLVEWIQLHEGRKGTKENGGTIPYSPLPLFPILYS
jgi:ATP/maltotriose-dependent transcriptional regulator MalT